MVNVDCACGCGSKVSAKTQKRHLAGQATPRVKALRVGNQRVFLSQPQQQQQHPREPSPQPRYSDVVAAPTISGAADVHESADPEGPCAVFNEPQMDVTSTEDARTVGEEQPGGFQTEGSRSAQMGSTEGELEAAYTEAAADAQREVWSNGHRVTVEDYESDEEEMDARENREEEDDDDDFFLSDPEDEFDELELLYGLPVEDIVDEDLERELADFGTCFLAWGIFTFSNYALFQPKS